MSPRSPRPAVLAALLLASTGLLAASSASADILAPDTKVIRISVTFTIEDKGHLVAFPTECTLANTDFELNPQLKFYPTYDVLESGKPREPYKFCGEKTALYVLDEAAFPKVQGTEPADWRRSEWRIAALDKIPINERAAFFASNAGVRATGYTMPAFGAINDRNPIDEVTERVVVSGGKVTKAETTYVYTDAVKETLQHVAGRRPQPGRKAARDWMEGLVEVDAPAAAQPSGTPGTPAAPAAPGASASSCGCSLPGSAPMSSSALALGLALGLALRRRRQRRLEMDLPPG